MKDNLKRHYEDPSDDGHSCPEKGEKSHKKKKITRSEKGPSVARARDLFESAKQNWLFPKQESDYEIKVKKLLRKCIKVLENENDAFDTEEDQEAKFSLRTQANDALTLFCIQKSNYKPKEVYRLLRDGGYVARLSQDVLRYKFLADVTNAEQPECQSSATDTVACPCRVYDNALPEEDLDVLISALRPISASYWKDHSYSVYPPTPYFSYAFDLKDETLKQLGALGKHVQNIKRLSSELFADKTERDVPQYAEVWAHHRPHCSGHQLHFDSDNEGRGEVKHPLVSSIIYLSDEGCGGPSLITDQRLGDTQLAQNGWLSHPKLNRLVVFDGSVLHGVIPGRGFVGERHRVTLMVALWKDIRIREGDEPGAARPLPKVNLQRNVDKVPEWYNNLTVKGDKKGLPAKSVTKVFEHTSKKVEPVRLESVFNTSTGKKIKEGKMPHYDAVFQGF